MVQVVWRVCWMVVEQDVRYQNGNVYPSTLRLRLVPTASLPFLWSWPV